MKVHQCGACRDVKSDNLLEKGRAPAARAGRGLFFGHFHRAVAHGTAIMCCLLVVFHLQQVKTSAN
jgi:hypothetical protein